MAIDLGALTPKEAITAIYIGYYDRAPDPYGLQFWMDAYNEYLDGAADGDAGADLATIADLFSEQIETADRYPYFEAPSVASASAFLTSVYLNLFNRAPDAAGLAFWTDQLVTGSTPVGEIILAIIEGAQDSAEGNDLTTIMNKIDVACDWAQSAADAGIGTMTNPLAIVENGELVVTDPEAYDSAVTILDNVDDTAQSVTDGHNATDAFIAGYGNDAPVATDSADSVDEDGSLDSFVAATDADGDSLSYSIAPGDGPSHGTLSMNADGTYTYTPDADYVGTDTFTYTVTDPSGETDTATVTLTVANTNDAPVASGVIATTNEDSSVVVTPSFTDLDNSQGAPDTATISIGSNPANGSVVVNGNGTITYTPNADFNGTDSFQYIVTDGSGESSIATATVTVNAVNDAPVAADAAANATEGGAVIAGTVTGTDVDGPSLSFSLNNPAPAGLSFNPDGTFTFNPADPAYDSLDAGDTQVLTVPFTVTDGSATDGGVLTITVTGSNDAPTASAVTASGAEDGGAITVTPISSDVDADDTATYTISANPANGTVVVNGNSFSYTPNADFNGVDTFTYTVTDSQGATSSAVATVTVTAVNDAPVAGDVTVSSLEDEVVSGQLTATDVDGDQLTFSQAAGGNLQGGSLVLNSDGSYQYTPAADYNGTASFNYTVSDGNGGTDTHTVTINIAPVSDIFTSGLDNLNGGDGDDTFLGNEQTLNAGDMAVGGAGNDTVIVNVATGGADLNFAGFALDVETFQTTVEADMNGAGSATFDMSSSEITGNTILLDNSTADSYFNRVNMNPDTDGQFGNGDDNNDGTADDELHVRFNNVTNNADATFTTRPGQVAGISDQVIVDLNNRDSNGRIGAISFYGTPMMTDASGLEVASLSTEGSPLDVVVEDFNIPGATTMQIATDTTSGAADLTIGDVSGSGAVGWSTSPGTAGIFGFENPLDNSITTITGTGGNSSTGNGGVALATGNNGVTGSFGEGADTVLGGTGNDNLSGNGGNDVLDGANGHDVLNGGAGNDTLIGGAGNDTSRGGDGNDLLLGEAGSDSQFGDAGNDVIWADSQGDGGGVEFVDGGADNDQVFIRGENLFGRNPGGSLAGVDQLTGGTGVDSLTITGTNPDTKGLNDVQNFQNIFMSGGTTNFVIGNNSVFEADHDARVPAGGNEGTTTLDASGSNSAVLDASTLDEAITLLGGDGNDSLTGGRGNDTIVGDNDSGTNSGGNDTLLGGAGDDTFITGVHEMNGGDRIEGDSGDDTIQVNTDNGRSGINAGAGGTAVILNGGVAGVETLKVLDDSDSTDEGDLVVTLNNFSNIDGTSTFHDGVASGSDTPRIHIDGSMMDANESLIVNAGGNGFDTDIQATGGAGADTFNFGALLDAGDQVDGGDGFDTVTVSDSQAGDFTNVSNIECIVVTGANNGDTIVFGADAEAAFASGVTPRIKLQNGPNTDVTIDTTAFSGPVIIEDDGNDNKFNTGSGDDTIIASTGTDTFNTDGGDDVIRVSGGDLDITDVLNTGAGVDTVEMDNSTGGVNAVSNLNSNATVENYKLIHDGDRVVGTDADVNTLEFQNGNVNTLTEIDIDFSMLTDPDDSARVRLHANQQDADFAFNVDGSATVDTFEKRNDGVDNNIVFNGNGGNDNFILNGGDAGSTTAYSGGDGFDSVTLSGGQITDDGFVMMDTIENLQSEAGVIVNARLGIEADGAGLQQIIGSDAAAGNDSVISDSQFNNDLTVITGSGNDTFNFGASTGEITFQASAGEVTAADTLVGGTSAGDEIQLTADNNTADLSTTINVEKVKVIEGGDNNIGVTITNNTFTGVADGEIEVDATMLDDTGVALPEGGLTLNGGGVTVGRFTVNGGTGDDNITTGTQNDTVSSGDGNDTVAVGDGNDTVLLGSGNDTATLGTGNDNATGDAGNDNIDAGTGADTVDGGTGNDTMTGGQGIDELTGGSGNDRFRYVDVEDSFSLSRDIITDFVEADDCIVIESQLIFNAITAFNLANPGNPVPLNGGLGVGAGESTNGFNNAGVFINGQGNVGPGYAANFSDAQGAISQTARDGVADYILERNAGPNGEHKLWVDVNDDGVLNGLDLQIFVDVDTLSTQSAVYMIDTIAPTISDVTLSTAEVRSAVNMVSGDFDNNGATPDTASTYDSLGGVGDDTTFEGTLDGIDTDGGAVIYTNINGVTPVAGVITVVGTYGTLTVQANGDYTYQVGATAAQRAAIEALDDGDNVSDDFTVNIDDGSGNTASATFSVNVAGADDHPTVVTAGMTANYVEDAANAPLVGTVQGADVDAGDTVVYDVVGGNYDSLSDTYTFVGNYGTLVLNRTTGAYTYTPEATATQAANVQALAHNQMASDVFTVDLFDGDDPLATTTTITANWTGTNDQPDITVVSTDMGNLVENDPTPLASGTFNVVDIDLSDNVGLSVSGPALGGSGAASAGAAGFTGAGLVTTNLVAAAADAPAGTNFNWNFNAGLEQFDFLAQGETLTLTYTVTADDGQGQLNSTDSQTVTIKIEGTDDTPVIGVWSIFDTNAVALIEDVKAPVTGTLTTFDADISDTVTVSNPAIKTSGTYAGPMPNLAAMFSVDATAPQTQPLDAEADHGGLGAAFPALSSSSNVTWTFDPGKETFDNLAEGETLIVDYLVIASDNDGTTGSETVSITIVGTNDDPVISVAAGDADAAGLTENAANPLTATGTLTVTDVDISDTVDTTVAAPVTGGTYNQAGAGYPGDAAFDGMLTVNPALGLDADPGDVNNLAWTFDAGAETFEFLALGETLTLTYAITSTDPFGGTDTHNVTITVTGTNDAPDIDILAGDSASAALTENAAAPLTASDTLTVRDIDDSDTVTAAVTGAVVNASSTYSFAPSSIPADLLGMMSVTAGPVAADITDTNNLTWTFDASKGSTPSAFDFLADGETLVVDYTIKVTDDSGAANNTDTQTVTVTITGINDAPMISLVGPDSKGAFLTENAANPLTASDTLTVRDIDDTDTVTAAVTGSSVNAASTYAGPAFAGTAGMLTVTPGPVDADSADASNLTWTFDAGAETFEELAKGETLILDYTIKVTDDSGKAGNTDTETVSVTITGTNDDPVFSIQAGDSKSALLVEGDVPQTATGTVTVDDIDLSDTVAVTVTDATVNGNYMPNGAGNGSTPTSAQLQAMMSIAGSPAAADGVDGEITWTFDMDSAAAQKAGIPAGFAFDYLGNNETQTITYTLTGDDSNGGTDTQTVTVTINGTNDGNAITVEAKDSATGSIKEDAAEAGSGDATPEVTGTLTVTDIDDNDNLEVSVNTLATSVQYNGGAIPVDPKVTAPLIAELNAAFSVTGTNTGTKVVDNNGTAGNITWAFDSDQITTDLDWLPHDGALTITYTITADDVQGGTSTHTVTVTITGENDQPTVTGFDINGPTDVVFTASDVDYGDLLALTNPLSNGLLGNAGDVNDGTPTTATATVGLPTTTTMSVTDDSGAANAQSDNFAGVAEGTAGGDTGTAVVTNTLPWAMFGFGGNDQFNISGANAGNNFWIVGGSGTDTFTIAAEEAFGSNVIIEGFAPNEQIQLDIAGVTGNPNSASSVIKATLPTGIKSITAKGSVTVTATAAFTGTGGFANLQKAFSGSTTTLKSPFTVTLTNPNFPTGSGQDTTTVIATTTAPSTMILNYLTPGGAAAQVNFTAGGQTASLSSATFFNNGVAGFASLAALKAAIVSGNGVTSQVNIAFGVVNDGSGNRVVHAILVNNDGLATITAAELTSTFTIATLTGVTDLTAGDIAFV